MVNTRSKGRDKPVDDVTVRVFVGEDMEQEILDKLVQVELDAWIFIGISITNL